MFRWISLLALLLLAMPARAELIALDITSREPFANGLAFGTTGAYERIVGLARFAVDPAHVRNKAVIDLDRAPRNAKGKVEFVSDVFILQPKDLSKGNGAILYDVNNRGNKLALGMFNGASGNNPTTLADAGNGFLFRRGYTVVWCGWIGELLPGNHRLLLAPPVARDGDKPITGTVRFEMVADKAADSQPLSRREGHGSYSPTARGEKDGVLTRRQHEGDKREVVARDQWSLERLPIASVKSGAPGTLWQIRLKLQGGFQPGHIYELVCECEGPIVQGLGFVAVRDLISFLKHDTTRANPALHGQKSALSRAHGFGVSQSGRFLRHLLYQGFNIDEQGRKVFDGLMPHVAGGGLGFFNHRFAQPTRHNGQQEEHLYPCDIFPFTYGDSRDEIRRSPHVDGILKRIATEDARLLPKVMHTQSAAEYWHRSGSLVHTNTLGTKDADIPANVRIFAFGGTQHGPAAMPVARGNADNLHNPGDYRPQLRALLDALDAWVRDGTEPPPSVYPRIDKGTLVDWKQASTGFPTLPGVRYPGVIQQPPIFDLGPDFATKGIVGREPPPISGHYPVLVPKSGPDGNDLGCLLPLEVAVPLATYTGWNLRRREAGADGALASLLGSYLPFPATEAERTKSGDPRPSITKRYGSWEAFVKQRQAESARMVKERYLLEEDATRAATALAKMQKSFPDEGEKR